MKDTESRGIFPKLFGGKKSACCDLTSETSAPASIANEAKGADGLVSATFQIVGLGCACEGRISNGFALKASPSSATTAAIIPRRSPPMKSR